MYVRKGSFKFFTGLNFSPIWKLMMKLKLSIHMSDSSIVSISYQPMYVLNCLCTHGVHKSSHIVINYFEVMKQKWK